MNNHCTVLHKMTDKVPVIEIGATLADVSALIKKDVHRFDTISYIYVVDKEKKLVNIFSLKELYRLPHDTKVEHVPAGMPLVKISSEATQEEAVVLALKHEIKNIPVVDKHDVFLGTLRSHVLLSILHKEAREDIFHLTGIHKGHSTIDNILEIPLFQAFRHRIVWLFLGLLGGILASRIVESFENVLEKNLILAAFIPLIVYMADAVGTQMEAFVIRDFAIYRKVYFFKYFLKQLAIVFMVAIFCAIFMLGAGFVIYKDIWLSIVIAIALSIAIISSVFTGLIIPYIFSRFKMDPANASGPIATIIQDLLSVVIYFVIASQLL